MAGPVTIERSSDLGMNLSSRIQSDITIFGKYSKYLPSLSRRETWEEIVNRNMQMHIKKFPGLQEEIMDNYPMVFQKEVLPSMRSLQFGGKPIELSPNRLYNCCYLPIDDYRAFSETMFLLLGGTGVGYSVQRHHVEKLPEIRKPNPNRRTRFLIGDSIEGWADSIKHLMKAYFGFHRSTPRFDFSDIRPKGARLVTSGGKAPGPEPLRLCLTKIKSILREKEDGSRLTSLEAHDIMCIIADAVLAGGIRRAAMIALFSLDDEEMITCKYPEEKAKHPHRERANNSAVILRHRISRGRFNTLWNQIRASGSGEPGLYFTHDKEWGTNPCAEIALRPFSFCNLVEINGRLAVDQATLNRMAQTAAFLGTLQAAYTDFHYLRDIWKRTTEKDALLGIGMTGICSGNVLDLDLKEAAELAVKENRRVAEIIGINPAARVTCVKPSGTTSLVLGTSSGIHGWYARHYIRRHRTGKNEALYQHLAAKHQDLVVDDHSAPSTRAVIEIPQKAPEGATFEDESAIKTLGRVQKVYDEWIVPGHISGDNTHNVSCTLYLEGDEWDIIGDLVWCGRDHFNGLSFFPRDEGGHSYVQPPHEEIDEERYQEMLSHLSEIDLSKIVELDDATEQKESLACAGNNCQI